MNFSRIGKDDKRRAASRAAFAYLRSADGILQHFSPDLDPSSKFYQPELRHAPFSGDYALQIVYKVLEGVIGDQADNVSPKVVRDIVKEAQREFRGLVSSGFCHPQGFRQVWG